MTIYHHIEVDGFSDYGITANPKIPRGTSFITGRRITASLFTPLVFLADYPGKIPHFLGNRIPIFSSLMVETLQKAGADNFEAFPATVKNPQTGTEWSNYFAINVIGLLSAINMSKSEHDVLMSSSDEGIGIPLLGLHTITLEMPRTHDLLMFRLAESPSVLLIHDLIMNHIDANAPPGGWGFDATEVQAV